MNLPRCCCPLAALALALGLASEGLAQDLGLRAGNVLVAGDQEPLRGATLVVRGGRVVSASTEKPPEGLRVVDLGPAAWIVPGFVDAGAGLGLRGDADEPTETVQPDVEVALRIDPGHRDFRAARRAGITTCLVAPGDRNLFGGAGALVKSSGEVLPGAVAKLALGPWMLDPGRPPTSRSGALALLRQLIGQRHRAEGTDVLTRFAKGEVPGVWRLGGAADLEAALDLGSRYGLRLLLQPAAELEARDLEGLDLSGQTLALGPFSRATSARQLALPRALVARKARVAFVSGAPQRPAGCIRLSAALAVRYGLPARDAFLALTRWPAEALGLGERVGTLEAGRDADLVVLDGPPLALGSRVRAVYVAGRRVHHRSDDARHGRDAATAGEGRRP